MDILITAAGKSSRFGGVDKYLLEIFNYPMLFWALKSLDYSRDDRYYVALSSPENIGAVEKVLKLAKVKGEVFSVGPTTGQAQTVALAAPRLSGGPFLVIPADTILQEPLNPQEFEGNSILTFPSTDYKSFSFVKLREGKVTEVVEKQPGDLATAGYYSFSSVETYLKGWELVDHSREEYVSHVYTALIAQGIRVTSRETEASNVVDLGTPQKLEENLPLVFKRLKTLIPQKPQADLGTIKELLSRNPNPDNKEVLGFVEEFGETSFNDRVGFGSLAHVYNMGCTTINSLLLEDDLSWLTFFIYDSVDTPYSLWRFLEKYKGANLFVIEDSPAITFKVPHKRQAILDHFTNLGKEWIVLFDDDFAWRLAYKVEDSRTPKSVGVSFSLALKILSGLAVKNDYDALCTGTNTRRVQYTNSRPLISQNAPIYWNFFLIKTGVLQEHGIHFVTDKLIHEDIAFSLDLAKVKSSAYALFLFQSCSYDFNNHALNSRDPETEAYGKGFWRIKEKLQNGVITKFFSINPKAIQTYRERKSQPTLL